MRIAFVTPWFGPHLTGGAESIAYQAARGLASRGHHITVLTTTSRAFSAPWSNQLRAGEQRINDLRIIRFSVDPRDAASFDAANTRLLEVSRRSLRAGVSPVSAETASAFVRHNINSAALVDHLSDGPYDSVIFMPYLYGVILRGWQVCADRAYLQPCLHDEPYAYLPDVVAMMYGVRGLFFNSFGEFEIARRLYGPGIVPRSRVVGAAIELDRSRMGNGSGKYAPFVLYLGRREDTKNVGFLCEAFRSYRASHAHSALQLVLAGPGDRSYDDRSAGIVDLGFISEAKKIELLQTCKAVVQPSINESYSRAVMEGWYFGKPVAVHRLCRATSGVIEECNGGWVAADKAEWGAVFDRIAQAEDVQLADAGARGKAYAEENASWPSVLTRYEEALSVSNRSANREVPQWIAHVAYAEGPTLQAVALSRAFAKEGITSPISAGSVDERLATHVKVRSAEASAGCLTHSMAPSARPPAIVYHGEEAVLHAGDVAQRYIPNMDYERWNAPADETLLIGLQDGRTNIVNVATVCEENRQHELLQMFAHYLSFDLHARLVLVGNFEAQPNYYEQLLSIVEGSALSRHVLITGTISDAALGAIYRTAHAYCTTADRHALGATLVEAMAFDIPICAFACAGARTILGSSGILLRERTDLSRIASLLRLMATDQDLRSRVLQSQNVRLRELEANARQQRELIVASLAPEVQIAGA